MIAKHQPLRTGAEWDAYAVEVAGLQPIGYVYKAFLVAFEAHLKYLPACNCLRTANASDVHSIKAVKRSKGALTCHYANKNQLVYFYLCCICVRGE